MEIVRETSDAVLTRDTSRANRRSRSPERHNHRNLALFVLGLTLAGVAGEAVTGNSRASDRPEGVTYEHTVTPGDTVNGVASKISKMTKKTGVVFSYNDVKRQMSYANPDETEIGRDPAEQTLLPGEELEAFLPYDQANDGK